MAAVVATRSAAATTVYILLIFTIVVVIIIIITTDSIKTSNATITIKCYQILTIIMIQYNNAIIFIIVTIVVFIA